MTPLGSPQTAYAQGLADGRAEDGKRAYTAWSRGFDEGIAITYAMLAHDLAAEGYSEAAWQVAAWANAQDLLAVSSSQVLPEGDPRARDLP